MNNINKEHYTAQYKTEIEYKYKTNTRYQRYLIECLEKYMNCDIVKSVCDVGCGQGLNTVLFLNDFPKAKVLGIDLSETGISYAIKKYKQTDERIDFVCADITQISINNNYELVTAFELLEHIEKWEEVAVALCKASSKYIMISSPVGRMRKYEIKHGHFRNFQKGELESFFNLNGYRTIKTFYAGFPFWSPIMRDLINLIPGDTTKIQGNLSRTGKFVSVLLYYLFRYCSSKRIGDQFVGLFEKAE